LGEKGITRWFELREPVISISVKVRHRLKKQILAAGLERIDYCAAPAPAQKAIGRESHKNL
jgi:hypothetical protein